MRFLLPLLALTATLGAETPNLVRDGSFAEATTPTAVPNIENHPGAYVWKLPTLPGWALNGNTSLHYSKHNGMRSLDVSGGTASQSIATLPGKTYRLTFGAFVDGEFKNPCTLNVKFGGTSLHLEVTNSGAYYWAKATAKDSSLELAFSGGKQPGGPRLVRVKCVEFNPAGEPIQAALEGTYREMDRGEKYEKDIAQFLAVLTDDFSWQPLEGQALDRAGYEAQVRRRIEKKFKVNTQIVEVNPNSDGSASVEVERRETEPGNYGKLDARAPHYLHTWIKSGNSWKLKSAQELPAAE